MSLKLMSNNFRKDVAPNVKLSFDTDAERIAFVDHLDKLDFNGSDWVAVRGVIDVVKVRASPAGAQTGGGAAMDPVTAIANAVSSGANLANTILSARANKKDFEMKNNAAKESKYAELAMLRDEFGQMDPIIRKIFEQYPFIKAFYNPSMTTIVDAVMRNQQDDNAWAALNSICRNIILNVVKYSENYGAVFTERVYYPFTYLKVDFSKEFAEHFRVNPKLITESGNNNTGTDSNTGGKTADTSKQSGISPILIIGGIFVASQFLSKSKGKTKKSK